ncbi:uncharacterized protein LOC135125956 [Zophobas morio]|uniref:uncharacterized protein LOC135125956 n=1 Tax=Zophobas morio TaxID=2755281 RepID=UPI0030829399
MVRKQNNNWLSDRNSDVAIKIRNRHMGIKDHTKGNKGWIRIEMTGYHIYCCYISPNIERNEFEAITDEIMTEVKTRAREAIIMGDINAKSYQWGLATADVRGEYWTMWMAEINSIVINKGTTATFIRGESKPYIDVTCATIKITKDIKSWKVLDDEGEILTYYQYIYFEIGKTTNPGKREQVWANVDSNKDPQEVNKRLVKIRSKCLVEKEGNRRKKRVVPYWWNTDIENARKECTAARRK